MKKTIIEIEITTKIKPDAIDDEDYSPSDLETDLHTRISDVIEESITEDEEFEHNVIEDLPFYSKRFQSFSELGEVRISISRKTEDKDDEV
jgi:hypothetical protein